MASRKDQKDQRRAERVAAEQSAAKKQQRQRTYGIVAGGVLVVGVIIAVIVLAGGGSDDGKSGKQQASYGPEAKFAGAIAPPAKKQADLFSAAKAAGCELKNPPIEGSTHVASKKPLKYGTNPPTSGNHDTIPQPDGVYSQYPQPRHTLHSLEGGRIALQYDPKLDKQDIAKLGGIFNDDNVYMVMFPNPKMPYAVAVTSWGHLAGCKKVTEETYDVVRDFIERYRDQSPEPAATHQPAINGQGWPDGLSSVPGPHKNGAIPGS